jgi:hypothetical protein
LATEYCWGEVWGDETLSQREHSILTSASPPRSER